MPAKQQDDDEGDRGAAAALPTLPKELGDQFWNAPL
jgi:hypothetical protein